jgi:hypothetical protein
LHACAAGAGNTVPAGAVRVRVEKFWVSPFVDVNFAAYATWLALTELELKDSAAPLTDVAAVRVNGIESTAGSDVVESRKSSVPAWSQLVTPLAVKTIGSPALTEIPVVIVTEVSAAETVAVKHPWD